MKPTKGAVPKSRQGFQKSSKTPHTPPEATGGTGTGDESVYQCEVCLITDNQEKVCCDICQLWFHFKCVNVTSEVATRLYWACMKCEEKHQHEPMPNKTNEEVTPNPPVTSTITSVNNENNLSGATGQVANSPVTNSQIGSGQDVNSQVLPSQIVDGQSTIIRDNVSQPKTNTVDPKASETKKPAKSQKSISISSSVSRRTALALQRLEEEKQLREKREREDQERRDKNDREYFDKKYSLLENDSEGEVSNTDEELDMFKRDRTQKWSEGIPKADKMNLSIAEGNVGVKSIISKLNRSVSLQPTTVTSRKGTERLRRLSQSSNTSIKKAKIGDTALPSWLTAPLKPTANLFPWKASSPSRVGSNMIYSK